MAEEDTTFTGTSNGVEPLKGKAVHRFVVAAEEEAENTETMFAFVHNLGTPDILVFCQDSRGKSMRSFEYTVQDDNIVVVRNDYGQWRNGDKIVVIG